MINCLLNSSGYVCSYKKCVISKGREKCSLTEGRITNMGIGNKIKTLNPISFGKMY